MSAAPPNSQRSSPLAYLQDFLKIRHAMLIVKKSIDVA